MLVLYNSSTAKLLADFKFAYFLLASSHIKSVVSCYLWQNSYKTAEKVPVFYKGAVLCMNVMFYKMCAVNLEMFVNNFCKPRSCNEGLGYLGAVSYFPAIFQSEATSVTFYLASQDGKNLQLIKETVCIEQILPLPS